VIAGVHIGIGTAQFLKITEKQAESLIAKLKLLSKVKYFKLL